MHERSTSPVFSIVVPSYNQGEFLKDCLESLCKYPRDFCEIIVMDGGSTDNSVDIIKEFADRIDYWQSQPDGGQAAAIKAGFSRSSGQLLGWLNSDDLLLDGALEKVADYFRKHPEVEWAFGNSQIIDRDGQFVMDRFVGELDYRQIYWGSVIIPQESTFWRRDVYMRAGGVDESLYMTMDYDLWLRMGKISTPGKIDGLLGVFRKYQGQKSSPAAGYRQQTRMDRERHERPAKPSSWERFRWYCYHRYFVLAHNVKHRGLAYSLMTFPIKQFKKLTERGRGKSERIEGLLLLLAVIGMVYLLVSLAVRL